MPKIYINIECQIFKLNQIQQNMSSVVPYGTTFKKNLQACASKTACLLEKLYQALGCYQWRVRGVDQSVAIQLPSAEV